MTKKKDKLLDHEPEKPNEPYKVGYKHPPPEHKFKKGVSGNWGGRPKKKHNVHLAFFKLAHKPMSIIQNGKACKTSYFELVVTQFLKSTATNPKPYAVALVLKLAEQSEAVVKSLVDDTNVDSLEWTKEMEALWQTLDVAKSPKSDGSKDE